MSSEEENEEFGPKVGIKLTLDQASIILQRHLNLHAVKYTHINRGYNNRVYIVTASNNQEFVIRLSGRFWIRYKTENELAALIYLAKKLRGSVPVPNILGYCTDKAASGVNAEYILMEKVEGEPLENVWKDWEISKKKMVLDQLAEIFASFQTVTFSQIGSFRLKEDFIGYSQGVDIINPHDTIDPVRDVIIGQGVEFNGGPFNSYLDYFKSSAETEIQHLISCSFMTQAENYEKRLSRIRQFVATFDKLETVPKVIREALLNVPFVFTHGDYEPRNILVDKDSAKVTGIIDWEFGGSYPIDEDWYTGFAFANADTRDWRVFNNSPPTRPENEGCEPEMIESLREYFLEQLNQNGVATPASIDGHMIRSELYYFKGFICPWWLREKRNPIPETHFNDRKNACEKVDYILEKYGF